MIIPIQTPSAHRLLWTGLLGALLALTGMLAGLSVLAANGPSPVWRLVCLALAAQIPYGAALFFCWKLRTRLISMWPILVISLFFRILLVPAPPVFSDDVYRYIWDGRLQQNGINPYRYSPEAPEVESLRDPLWEKINHKPLRTIYPPAAEMIFGATALLAPNPTGFKLLSALADTCVVFLIIVLAGNRRDPIGKPESHHGHWVGLVYGLHPIACIETGMSGHLEPLGIVAMLGALLFLRKNRPAFSAFFIALGAGIKLLPALLVPILARRRRSSLLLFVVVLAALYLPYVSAGTNAVETLDTFARRWEGNAGLFSFIKWMVQTVIEWITGADSADAMVHLPFLDPVARAAQDTFFSLHKDGGFDPMRPGAFTIGDLSLAISKLICGSALLATIGVVTIRRTEPARAAAWILGVLLLVTPILHPWYLLWILPLAAVLGYWPWFVLAGLVPLAYLPLDNWWAMGIWDCPPWIEGIEYGFSALALAAYLLKKHGIPFRTGLRRNG